MNRSRLDGPPRGNRDATFGADAARWHRTRARTMATEHRSFIRALHVRRRSSLVTIFVLTAAQLTMAAICGRLPIEWVLLSSATIGAFLGWGSHNFLHDVTHRSVALTGNPLVQAFLMRLCMLPHPDLSLYLYYRWHHIAHHKNLARDSVQEVMFGHDRDADALAISSFYRVKATPDGRPRSRTPGLFRSSPAKVLVGVFPLVDFLITNLLFIRHGLFFLIETLGSKRGVSSTRHRARGSALRHLLMVTCVQAVFWSLFGWKAPLFLLLSFLFVKGFLLHPYILFWVTIHKTTHHGDQCQPTTSTYGGSTNFIFWGLTNHVEHHDFPGVPSPDLPRLRERFPKHYDSLFSFTSMWDAYRGFLASDEAWVYGCQDA
ncbi:MAG: fatty acid desaturase [Myxococcota bacterium]